MGIRKQSAMKIAYNFLPHNSRMNKTFLKSFSKAFLMNAKTKNARSASAYVELLRLNNGVLAVLGIIIGAIVAGAFLPSATMQIALAIIAAFLINGAGNVINDCFDYRIDKVTRPNRPIPSGRIKRSSAAVYFAVLIAASLVLAYFVSRDFLYLAVINSLVSLVYSWKLKGMPLVGNAAVSWLAGSTFAGGALVLHSFAALPAAVFLLASIGFLGTLSREIFKDIEDVKGDKEEKARTLPIVIGNKGAMIVASIVLMLGIASLLVPLYAGLFSAYYYVGIVPAIIICLLAVAKKTPHKSQKLIKIAMYFIFLGFILGTVL